MNSSGTSTPVFGAIVEEYNPRHNVVAGKIADSKKFFTNECSDNYIFGSSTSLTTPC